MIDPSLLIFLSVALVPGTADSDPSTEGITFMVDIEPDVVASFDYVHEGFFQVYFKPGLYNQTVTVGLPIGLPLRADLGGHHNLEPSCHYTMREFINAIRGKGNAEVLHCAILRHSHTITDCHTLITVMVNNSVPIIFGMLQLADSAYAASGDPQSGIAVPRSDLHAKWLGVPATPPTTEPDPGRIVSPPVPDGCGHVLAWPPFDPPYRQVHGDDVLAGSVACNEGLVLRLRESAGGDEPLCVQPGTADELVRRGVLEDDLPAPRGHRVRP